MRRTADHFSSLLEGCRAWPNKENSQSAIWFRFGLKILLDFARAGPVTVKQKFTGIICRLFLGQRCIHERSR